MGATNINQSPAIGAAYVFQLSGGTWRQQAILIASDGSTYDYFGWSVSISADYIIVGAPGTDTNRIVGRGAAHIFSRMGPSGLNKSNSNPPAHTRSKTLDGRWRSVTVTP